MSLTQKFEKMGARVKIERLQPEKPPVSRFTGRAIRRSVAPGTPPEDFVRLDIRSDKQGRFFDVRAGINVELEVLDLKPKDRHLLLMARTREGKSKFLCGHDERDWFVAAIPESSSASSVSGAMEALKPTAVKEAQSSKKLKSKERKRRKTSAYVRQGEWFFLPRPDLTVDEKLVLPNEPLRRGSGKPHMAEFLYRVGGETVYVNASHPNGLTQKQFDALNRQTSGQARKTGNFRVMQRDPKAYVKGKIRHSDHKTIYLDCWHEVQMNTETQAKAMRHVYFLD